MVTKSNICCPKCHTVLETSQAEGEYCCPACGYDYIVQDGIIDFSPDDRFYWGEVSQERMEEVNRRAVSEGWFNAFMESIVGANQRDMANYLLDPVRIAGLFHFYNPLKHDVCIDLGSGWGPISFGLSKFYDTVYSMDGVYERLRFQAIRAEQEGIENIKIIKGKLLKLPFPDNMADTVIVNGLLEWIGLSDEVTDPRMLQMEFLREVRRVLKPDGRLFIGIENRTGAQFFFGSRDHSGLPFTSLMPRWLAGMVVKRARRMKDASFFEGARKSYRTLTYTFWGYQKLLSEAGFQQPDMYWTLPSYNEPRVSGTLDGDSARYYLETLEDELRDPIRRGIVRATRLVPAALLGGLIKLFAPHFLILTGKAQPEAGLQENALGTKTLNGLLRSTLHTERNLNTDFLVLERKGKARKISVTELKVLPEWQFMLEKPEISAGRPVHIHLLKDVRSVAAWLLDFQAHSDPGELSVAERAEEMARLVENTRWFADNLMGLVQAYSDIYREQTGITGLRVAREHGNFTPQNIAIRQDGEVQVTGWKDSRPIGNPLMDAGAFSLALLERPGLSAALETFERAYGQSSNMPLRLAPAYYILRMVERDMNPQAGEARNYPGRAYWSPRLKKALVWAVGERMSVL